MLDPEFTFDNGRCRMHIAVDLGHEDSARDVIEAFPPEVQAAYDRAVEEERREREAERFYRASVRATYDESRFA